MRVSPRWRNGRSVSLPDDPSFSDQELTKAAPRGHGLPAAAGDNAVGGEAGALAPADRPSHPLTAGRDAPETAPRSPTKLCDHLPIGYVIVGWEGELLRVNPAARALLQQTGEAITGGSLLAYLDSYDAGRLAAHLAGAVKSRRDGTLEVTLRLPDGSARSVQLASRVGPADASGSDQVHLAITDISQFKRTQRMLEEINREQEAFNYSISHDLRAPLVTISNYARIVLTDHANNLDEDTTRSITSGFSGSSSGSTVTASTPAAV